MTETKKTLPLSLSLARSLGFGRNLMRRRRDSPNGQKMGTTSEPASLVQSLFGKHGTGCDGKE